MEIKIPYNFEPREYQKRLFNSIHDGIKRGVFIWHRRSGKDKTLINLMTKEAMRRKGTYFYFFPTYAQGRKILWDGMDRSGFKFLDHIPKEIRSNTNNTEMKISLKNGSMIQVVGTDNVDLIVGTNPIGCVYSEYALQDPVAWEMVKPILRENGGWALFNSTPRGHNHLFDMYNMAINNPAWMCELLTVDDTGVISAEDIQADRDEGMSEDTILQEYYCSFSALQSGQFIPYDLVIAAVHRKYDYSVYRYAPVVISVDVAREGDDRSVIGVRQGVMLHEIKVFRKLDTTELTAQVVYVYNEWKKKGAVQAIFVDGVGIGGGVIDQLRRAGLRHLVWDVQSNAAPTRSKKYMNKRAEMWADCKEWLKIASIPDNKELINDLTNPEFEIDENSGKLKIESKKHMKESRHLPSSDCADMLVYSFYMPVASEYEESRYDTGADYSGVNDIVGDKASGGASKWTGY